MMRFIGRLILIPLGIALAAFSVLVFLGVVGMAQPDVARAVASTAFSTLEGLFRTALEGEEAIRQFGWSLVLFSRFAIVVLILPVTLVAVVAEFFAFRAWAFHALVAALLTAAMPFALMPDLMAGYAFGSIATAVLATAGALAGSIYWMIAGRSAGADPKTVEERATVKAPPIRR